MIKGTETMRYKTAAIACAITLALSGCTLNPATIGNAVIAHAQFPSFSMAVSDCLTGRPDVRQKIKPYWNSIVGKWSKANDLPHDGRLIKELANAPYEVMEAEREWLFIKNAILSAGITCDPDVIAMMNRIEQLFGEMKAAVNSNQRVVLVINWLDLLSNIATGRNGEVVTL